MCTYVYVRFVIGFFPSFHPWDPIGILRKSAAMPQCRGLVRTLVLNHWRAISKRCVFRERMWMWPKALPVLLSYLRRAL